MGTKLRSLIMKPKLAIEGGVGAGKSSTSAELQSRHGFYHLKEYMSFAANNAGTFLAGLEPDARFRYFLGIENTRVNDALKDAGDRPLVVDRCYLSILAFEFAQRRLGKAAISADGIRKLLADTCYNILIPDVIVFVDISEHTRMHRVNQRAKVVRGDLVSPEFNNSVRSFFGRISSCLEVKWLNGDVLSSEELVLECLDTHKLACSSSKRFGAIQCKIPEAILDAYSSD